MFSREFDIVHSAFHQFDWYMSPAQTQRVFKMILAHTQQPVIIIGGYAKASCSRDIFKKVFMASQLAFLSKINFLCAFSIALSYIIDDAIELHIFHGTSSNQWLATHPMYEI